MFSPPAVPAAVTAATTSLALPSSSVGAPPVAGPAQAHPLPPRTVAYPLWRTTTTMRRGVRKEKKKTKRRTRCSHRLPSRIRYRHHHLPGPPFLLRGRASRGRSRPGAAPAASDRGVPTVEDNDGDEEGG